MRFVVKSVPAGDFDAWPQETRGTGSGLDDAGYAELAKPSKDVPPTTYRSVEPKLFERTIDQTVAGPGKAGIGGAWHPPVHQAVGLRPEATLSDDPSLTSRFRIVTVPAGLLRPE
jgi:cytochrome o ubiquinol oxidase subunit 2